MRLWEQRWGELQGRRLRSVREGRRWGETSEAMLYNGKKEQEGEQLAEGRFNNEESSITLWL